MNNVPDGEPGRQYFTPKVAAVVPDLLKDMQRWTGWVMLPPKKAGAKPGKKPLSPTNDSKTWRTFQGVTSSYQMGIGFQMLGVSTICGLDLDGCLDPTTGALSGFAQSLLAALPGTYAEVTPSGKGLRIFATIPDGMKVPEFLAHKHGVECYTGRSARFLTVTGNVLPGREAVISDMTPEAVRMLQPLASSTGEVELEIKLPCPATPRLEHWQDLFDNRLPYKKLRPEWREYLESGDLPGGRSERTFAIAAKMIEARYQPDEIFAVLVSAPGPWEAALDKRDQDITRARSLIWADVGRAQKVVRADETTTAERADEWSALGLRTEIRQRQVRVQHTSINGVRILTGHSTWKDRIALDVTSGKVLLDGTPLDDFRFFEMQEQINTFAGWEPRSDRQWWTDLIRAAAEKNPINPRVTELRSLVWDGTPRLDTWFTDNVADEDCPLNRTLGRKWILSLVARWLDPGCKVDTVLILQGVEGARKNTFFEVIAGGVERVVPCDGMERDDKFTVAQAWIAEMPEASIFRRADRNRLKGFITQAIDHYRPPYASNPVAVRRAFVLVSTSNSMSSLFNADQDGLRRFWPVATRKRINYEWVRENRDQILAEAVIAYDLGEEWWFDETPVDLRNRVEFAVEFTALDEAIIDLIRKRAGQGGMGLTDIIVELGAVLGYRPNDRTVVTLLEKHGLRRRRSSLARSWVHPSWARPGVAGEADIIPLHPEADEGADEVAS